MHLSKGGTTFSNFNVDAIQEIQAQSVVMPPEIGAGAAGYTNVATKQGSDQEERLPRLKQDSEALLLGPSNNLIL
jgi:hypothetical protein